MTSQLALFRPPLAPRVEPELVVIGTPEDCRALLRRRWSEVPLRTAAFLCPGDEVPRYAIRAAWATPREKLPPEFVRELDALRADGGLEEWQP